MCHVWISMWGNVLCGLGEALSVVGECYVDLLGWMISGCVINGLQGREGDTLL